MLLISLDNQKENEVFEDEIQETESSNSINSFGNYLSDSQTDSEIIPITMTDDILIDLHQVDSKQLEQIEKMVENQIRIGNDLTTILGILYLIVFYIALKSLAKLFNDIIFRHF